jgi:hypothetical protein
VRGQAITGPRFRQRGWMAHSNLLWEGGSENSKRVVGPHSERRAGRTGEPQAELLLRRARLRNTPRGKVKFTELAQTWGQL